MASLRSATAPRKNLLQKSPLTRAPRSFAVLLLAPTAPHRFCSVRRTFLERDRNTCRSSGAGRVSGGSHQERTRSVRGPARRRGRGGVKFGLHHLALGEIGRRVDSTQPVAHLRERLAVAVEPRSPPPVLESLVKNVLRDGRSYG